MRKFCIFALSFFSVLYISCSNGAGSDKIISESATIKQLTFERDSDLLWTRELESVRLLLDVKKNQAVSDNVLLEPVVMICANTNKAAVYPYLENFGSLDTSSISKELRTFLDGSCEHICEWKPELLMLKDSALFSLILFKYDIENQWTENFNEDFPVVSEEQKLFDSWFYGEPFINDGELQIPVRFAVKKGFIDIKMFIDSAESFKIDGIQILKWERK